VAKQSRYHGKHNPELDHQREGSVRQYESDWVKVNAGASMEVAHELGEVPRTVDVQWSESEEGVQPRAAVCQDASRAYLTGEATVTPTDMGSGGQQEIATVTVAGAALGDFVEVSMSTDQRDCALYGWVEFADSVVIRMDNLTTSSRNSWVSSVFYVSVRKRASTEATVAKSDAGATRGSETTTVTVTNNMSEDRFIKVRAL
jgi:hypothetical protein